MNLKEKQIEEMSRDDKDLMELCKLLFNTWDGTIINLAKKLLEHYQPKLAEDSFVLTETERITMCVKQWDKGFAQGSKETAEKFLQLAYDWTNDKFFIKKVEELAKQFGIEIKD